MSDTNEMREKKSKSGLIIALVIVAIILGGAVFGIVKFKRLHLMR